MLQNSIYLIGFMGAGKTSIGQALGKALDYPVIDTDEQIELQEGQAIRDIFAQFGEEYFRNLESKMLHTLSAGPAIITTGGGIILKEKNRVFLQKSGQTVFLQASPKIIVQRLENDLTRPLIKNKSFKEINDLYEMRLPLYEECADFTINTDSLSIEKVVEQMMKRMNLF